MGEKVSEKQPLWEIMVEQKYKIRKGVEKRVKAVKVVVKW
jgi:hypothetical protein